MNEQQRKIVKEAIEWLDEHQQYVSSQVKDGYLAIIDSLKSTLPKRSRCACVRCGRVMHLFPEEIGALHYTQRDGYVCGPEGRFMPAPKEKR